MRVRFILLPIALLLGSCAAPRPTPASQTAPLQAATAQGFVIAANPLAARAGMEVLERGGSAVDAAIAVQAMLGLVEPQSSGIGGGAFMTYYDAASKQVLVYDGREVAPAQATPDMFLDSSGQPLPFEQAVLSGRATGVPGAVKMLALAHDEHGKLPWNSLFSSAERTADEGFIVSPRLAKLVVYPVPENGAPDVIAYFHQGPGGALVKAGDRLVNKSYAAFLRRLASQGPSALYGGETGARILARTRAAPLAGSMTMTDLANYKPVKREPLCAPYRVYMVCTPPPPGSGVGTLELLGLLAHTDIDRRSPNDPQAWYLFAEASRLMYADRDRYVGDPAFTNVPAKGLLAPEYLAERAKLIGDTAGPPPAAGNPAMAPAMAADHTYEPTGTSHFIIHDAAGNVVSMTTTVESLFGSGRMVDGFFLNNQMTDFSFSPVDAEGRPAANAVAAGKRPRSSMTPLLMLDGDRNFAGAFGSAGGNSIIVFVAKSMVAAIDWNLPTQEALAAPNLVARGANFNGEVTKFSPEMLAALKAKGIDLKPGQGEDSGVHAVMIRNGQVDGGYDPRREGVVLLLGR